MPAGPFRRQLRQLYLVPAGHIWEPGRDCHCVCHDGASGTFSEGWADGYYGANGSVLCDQYDGVCTSGRDGACACDNLPERRQLRSLRDCARSACRHLRATYISVVPAASVVAVALPGAAFWAGLVRYRKSRVALFISEHKPLIQNG